MLRCFRMQLGTDVPTKKCQQESPKFTQAVVVRLLCVQLCANLPFRIPEGHPSAAAKPAIPSPASQRLLFAGAAPKPFRSTALPAAAGQQPVSRIDGCLET